MRVNSRCAHQVRPRVGPDLETGAQPVSQVFATILGVRLTRRLSCFEVPARRGYWRPRGRRRCAAVDPTGQRLGVERDNHGESGPGGDNLTILAALQQVARSDATARVIPVSHPAEDGAVQFQFVDLALEDSSWQLVAPEQVGRAVKI